MIVRCPNCRRKNRIPTLPPSGAGEPVCGSCGAALPKRRPFRARFARFCAGVMFTLDAVFLLLLGVFVVLDTAGPEHWWVTGFLLYMPRWIWAVAGALLLLLTAPTARRGSAERRAGRRLTGLLAVAVAWSLGPLMGFEVPLRLPASAAPSARRTSLRVLTYNVKSGHHDPHAIAWEIEQAKPDLVQFQDSGKVLLTEVGSVLSAAKGWNLRREGQYVVASRWPLSELTRIDLDVPDPRFFAVRATLTPPDGAPPITVYNVHLLSARYGLLSVRSRNIQVLEQNLEDRLTQADKVAAAIRTGPTGPILLTGDLNAPPSSMAKRSLLSTGLRDAFEASGWGYGFTYGTSTKIGRPYVRIDCILASPDFRADSIYVGNDIGSEHRPVIADLTLTQN